MAPATSHRHLNPKTVAAFIAVAVIGGGNAVSIKVGLTQLAPFWGAAVRFLVASVLLLGLMVALRRPIPRGRALIGASIYGALNFGFAFAFGYFALTEVTAGTAQVAIALTPMVVVVLSAAHGIEVLRTHALFGALISFAGTCMIFIAGIQGASIPKLIALLAAVICFAEAAITVKRFPRVDPVSENAIGQGVGGAILLALSLIAGEAWNIPTDTSTIASLLFLIFFGSMALFGLYVYVIEQWSASAASYALVAMPVFTVIFAGILLGERVTPYFLVGSTIVAIGLYVGVFSQLGRGPRSIS